jgi:hypothetical protein
MGRHDHRPSESRLVGTCVLAVLVLVLVLASPPVASAETPWWRATTEVFPTHLPPQGEGTVVVQASNLSDTVVDGAAHPVKITDRLPAGVTAVSASGELKGGGETVCPHTLPLPTPITCTYNGALNPYEEVAVTLKVKVEESPGSVMSLPNEVTTEGGGATATATSTDSIAVNGETAVFGIQSYEVDPLNDDGTPATGAGTHPFQLTTTLVLNQTPGRRPIALPKDLRFELPPGLVGNPSAAAQCTMTDFSAVVGEANLCPASSAIGVASVVAFEPIAQLVTKTVPVFNLVPAQGEPARFGFELIGRIPVIIDASVRSGSDYGVDVSVNNATQTGGLLSSEVTLWGVPADPRHNAARGWECVAGGYYHNQVGKPCPATTELEQKPFLRLPTSCASNPSVEPTVYSAEADSWTEPGSFSSAAYSWVGASGALFGFEGCAALPFSPSVGVLPEEHAASTPTGLTVDVRVPQASTLEAGALAEADVRDSTVTLPAGVDLSPSAANGLAACSEAQVGFVGLNASTGMDEFTSAPAACPDASKLGTVEVETPLLPNKLTGSLYLASPAPNGEAGVNPFGSLVALYLVAEDPVSGVLVKLAGEGVLNEATLRVSTTFRSTPQVPFSNLKVHLFAGPRASVSTPAFCGDYATEAVFTPWSGTGPVGVASPVGEFGVEAGVSGAACAVGSLAFVPGFVAQSESSQAGGFTNFALEVSHRDGDQALSGVTVTLPPGNAALLSTVALCSTAQAAADSCPAGSEIGQAQALAGLGSEPYVESGGRVFITGPYEGAPFGLEIVTPAVAGPFNLGYVVVRSKIEVNPSTAAITIVTPSLPTQLRGIPLQLKRVLVHVGRPGFEFNPTNCAAMKIEGTIGGAEGASAGVSAPFQVGNCQGLPFSPKLTAAVTGHGSKLDGTSFAVNVESSGVGPGGVAQDGIAKVDLQLPLELSSRLPTLQKACLEAVFDANPADCDEGSVIGYATIHTPVLNSPLTGPAYLVSHGGAEFPDVEFVLQGEGITLVLDGKTNIKAGITYSKFESTPDAPFTRFETTLPAGPHGVLSPNVPEKEDFSLCKQTLAMPTTITAQDGAVIEQDTNVAVTGCSGVLANKTKLTRAQLLTKALKACRKDKQTRKRLACEKQARKRYAPKKPAHTTEHKAAIHSRKDH